MTNMTLDFTAVDFETANSFRGSPCSVGLVKVRDGQIVNESSTLIHPPARFDYFDGFNIGLHGISAEMVAGAPRWRQVAGWIVRYTGHRLIRPGANPDADPDHPFYGQVIVFTGALMSRTRQMAWDDVARVGGIPELSVTRHTNVLVIGDINPAVLAPGMVTTGKAAKVFALQAKGQDIELMAEDDFLRSL
jgi:hypothetical protein